MSSEVIYLQGDLSTKYSYNDFVLNPREIEYAICLSLHQKWFFRIDIRFCGKDKIKFYLSKIFRSSWVKLFKMGLYIHV